MAAAAAASAAASPAPSDRVVYLLDYGAGNVQSIRNAISRLDYRIHTVRSADDIRAAPCLVFPGVGRFGQAVASLHRQNFFEPLREYLRAGRPYLGICIGMQVLFEGSDEDPDAEGLGLFPGRVRRFPRGGALSVPHMGWNSAARLASSGLLRRAPERFYFVHSYRVPLDGAPPPPWALAATDYGGAFVAAVQRGRVAAVQFHPEKSAHAGLALLGRFLDGSYVAASEGSGDALAGPGLARRVIACLDVRTNDAGDLVVTKGDQYDVRDEAQRGEVRNLGKPVALAARYYEEGADEITFLNITSFREGPLTDAPMLRVLERASERVFVPLTIGGGIRDYRDPDSGRLWSALDVAAAYFRAGADKVSIGSDAVRAAEAYWAAGACGDGTSSLETISAQYGVQAVVVSVDPVRVWVRAPEDTPHAVVECLARGPHGERFCWYQCTVKGGRDRRDLDVVQLAVACEALGAGELLVNSIDQDGQRAGYDVALVDMVCAAVHIPVIASSGAGTVEHFEEVFRATRAEAALAAGIFHHKIVPIAAVKAHLERSGIPARLTAALEEEEKEEGGGGDK